MKPLATAVGCIFLFCILSCPSTPILSRSGQAVIQSKTDSLPISEAKGTPGLSIEAKEIMRPNCGSCHTSTLSTAKPGAVKVFDLAQEHWLSTASQKQLDSFLSRLKNLPKQEHDKVVQFVQQEKARRASL